MSFRYATLRCTTPVLSGGPRGDPGANHYGYAAGIFDTAAIFANGVPSSAQLFDIEVTDSVAVSDTLRAGYDRLLSSSDTANATDAASTVSESLRSLTDTAAATDVGVAGIERALAGQDSVTVSDAYLINTLESDAYDAVAASDVVESVLQSPTYLDPSCEAPGWGSAPWGLGVWGGGFQGGGPLPIFPPFDVYCIGPCGPMANVMTYSDVTAVQTFPQMVVDPVSFDLLIQSGSPAPTTAAQLYVTSIIPQTFTFEFTAYFDSLPYDFSDVANRHVFFGTFDAQGAVIGLLISEVGIAYTGSARIQGGVLQLDGPVQVLPNSQTLIEEDAYITFRLAVDSITKTAYIYVTKSSQVGTLGHQLRYVMPALMAQNMAVAPTDQTMVSVRGTDANRSAVYLDSVCVGSGVVIPNLPPRADAGPDQAARLCSIVRLDGTRSFDPEGADILYSWRLVDAPPTSEYAYEGHDGDTYPLTPATGFTDRFYSSELASVHALDPITSGDVITFGGESYTITGVGTDGNGFFVRVGGYVLPDSLSAGTTFLFLRQRGLSAKTTAKPTFYPDVSGFYRFDLRVFDGSLYSSEISTVVNVVESATPRGVIPDLRFLWNYLSDFWRLVEDKERIEVFWSALAQVAAAELLNLWQIEYSKSLRDIQRTVQRKWLHYDFRMVESLPDLGSAHGVLSGVESSDIPVAGVAAGGQSFTLSSPHWTTTWTIPVMGAGLLTAQAIADQVQSILTSIDNRMRCVVITSRDGTLQRIRIDAPFVFTVDASTTVFSAGRSSGLLSGTGSAVSPHTYRLDRSLQGVDVQEGDLLVLDGVAYRIARVVTGSADNLDAWPSQRVTLLDDMELPAATSWKIAGRLTSKTLDFHGALVSQGDEVSLSVEDLSTQVLSTMTVLVVATCPTATGSLGVDLSSVAAYLAAPSLYAVSLSSVLRRTYLPVDELVVDVPTLQEAIKSTDDSEVLRRNVDFFIETYRGLPCMRFITGTPDVWQGGSPPDRMWAEYTYLDNRPTIEANFGIPAGFTLDDLSLLPENVDYLSSVRGLWFTYFNGPTLFNLRAGTQILLGLPFAEEEGVIEEIRDDLGASTARILLRDTKSTEIVRSYTYPAALPLETNPSTGNPYQVGDTVSQFAPIVGGVEVLDYVNSPRWFAGYLAQGTFFEVEKLFKFLVRVDSAAFNLAALLFVQSFVRRVKPTTSFPLFVVLRNIDETTVSVDDDPRTTGNLIISMGACAPLVYGAPHWDQFRSAGGGAKNFYDTDSDTVTTAPTSPTADVPVTWAHDRELLLPEDYTGATLTAIVPAGPMPFDNIFSYDVPLMTAARGFDLGDTLFLQSVSGGALPRMNGSYTASGAGNFNYLQVSVAGYKSATLRVIVEKNGVNVYQTDVAVSATGVDTSILLAPALAYVGGDVFTVRVGTPAASNVSVLWKSVLVVLATGTVWAHDTSVAGGTYYALASL